MPRWRWAAGLLLVLVSALVMALAGCGSGSRVGASVPAGSPSAVAPSPGPHSPGARTASPTATQREAPVPTGPAPLPPASNTTVTSITLPSIGLHTTGLEKLSLRSDGALAAPKDPMHAGWYAGGTLPGDIGPAVIAGHIDSLTGPAVFFELRTVRAGDKIAVGLSSRKTITFRVDRVITTAKNGFPTDAVFGPVPDAELRLITCGGPYDRSVKTYLDNTIVFATAT